MEGAKLLKADRVTDILEKIQPKSSWIKARIDQLSLPFAAKGTEGIAASPCALFLMQTASDRV